MNRLKKFHNKRHPTYDLVNTLLGVLLLILLMLIFVYPSSRYLSLGVFFAGGSMNILNGLKSMKDPKRKTMGMSFILFGMIIIFIGIFTVL